MQVLQALLALPATQRVALALRELLNASYDEIAEALELPRTAVGTLLFRARAGFRVAYDRVSEGAPPLDCPDLVPLFASIVDDQPRPETWQQLEAHLRSCERCQGDLEGQRRARRLYGLLPLLVLPVGWDPVQAALQGLAAGSAAGGVGSGGPVAGGAAGAGSAGPAGSAAAPQGGAAGTAAGSGAGAASGGLVAGGLAVGGTGAKVILASLATAAIVGAAVVAGPLAGPSVDLAPSPSPETVFAGTPGASPGLVASPAASGSPEMAGTPSVAVAGPDATPSTGAAAPASTQATGGGGPASAPASESGQPGAGSGPSASPSVPLGGSPSPVPVSSPAP